MKKEEIRVAIQEEVRRSLKSVDGKTLRRVLVTMEKYSPSWKRVMVSNKIMTICTMKGSNGGIVSTGIAWKAPGEEDNEETGKRISLSRAVRYLAAKRIGITS